MDRFGMAQTAARREDARFLTGRGRYIDDIAPQDALFAHFLRSPVAHAAIRRLDTGAARAAPGVRGVFTAADLEAGGMDLHIKAAVVRNRDGARAPDPLRPVLAKGRVRHVGEAVALIVADTQGQAKDAAELVAVDYDDRPVHLALAPGGPQLHDDAPENVGYDWALGDEAATEATFAGAAHRVALEVVHNRVIVNSLEPRGAFAEWREGRLHLALNGQGVWDIKPVLAEKLGLPPEAVRITTPDVGGGFGMKSTAYPEPLALAFATRALDAPVRWMSERTEAMLADNAGRDLVSRAELAFDETHRILAYRVRILSNLGAYNSEYGQFIQSDLSARVLTGVHDVQTVFVSAKGIYTNSAPVDAYRGAGRPEAIYTLERIIDHAARVLGTDPWMLREKNFIRRFPYATATGETYDVGDFPRVLARVRREAGAEGFAKRRAGAEARGRLRGLGLCSYIEAIVGDPSEDARIVFHEDGSVALHVGTQSNGQGHETVYAGFLSARTGIPVEQIRVVQGDSDLIPRGGGTGGSRSVTVQSNATIATVGRMVAGFAGFLSAELGGDGFAFDGTAFRAPGTNHALSMMEAAAMARRAGRADLLEHVARAKLPGRSYPNGAHVAEVEIDPDTGAVALVGYWVADDLGVLMHPRLAEGQVHGGVAQGVGQALCEQGVHDPASGQLLTATFMDYAMPRADMLPPIGFASEPVPSLNNPLGMKGCGEAGTVGALAAVANAVADALASRGVAGERVQMPFTPERVWRWLHEVDRVAAE